MKDMIKDIIREEMARSTKTYYFMAGLPRSGSTLLSAILNQNPKIYSGPNSPVLTLMAEIEGYLNRDEMFVANPKPEAAHKIISGIIDDYYSDVDKPIIIDKNRGWPAKIEYISGYLGQPAKIICPVRDSSEILASFIAMHRRNGFVSSTGRVNFIDQMLIKENIPLTDDNRCERLARDGVLGVSYNNIKDALIKGYQKQLHFVEYNDLVSDPENTIKRLYEFLELDYHEHDYSHIENVHKENDSDVHGFDDMHHVRPTIEKTSVNPSEILSEYILEQCKGAEFWRDLSDFNTDPNQPQENQHGKDD